MSQDAAIEKGVERIFDELGRLDASSGRCVGDDAGGALLHQAVHRSLFRAVSFVVERSPSEARWGHGAVASRWAPGEVSPHDLDPCSAPQSP